MGIIEKNLETTRMGYVGSRLCELKEQVLLAQGSFSTEG